MQISLGKLNISPILFALGGIFVIVSSLILLALGLDAPTASQETDARMVVGLFIFLGSASIAFSGWLQISIWKAYDY